MLERKKYTEEVFERRNKALHVKMDEVKSRIYELNTTLPKEVDYKGAIVKLKDAIAGLRNDDISVVAKNKLLRVIIERIEYEYLSYEGKGKVNYRLHIRLRI